MANFCFQLLLHSCLPLDCVKNVIQNSVVVIKLYEALYLKVSQCSNRKHPLSELFGCVSTENKRSVNPNPEHAKQKNQKNYSHFVN